MDAVTGIITTQQELHGLQEDADVAELRGLHTDAAVALNKTNADK